LKLGDWIYSESKVPADRLQVRIVQAAALLLALVMFVLGWRARGPGGVDSLIMSVLLVAAIFWFFKFASWLSRLVVRK
jgi:hypothetical protein